MRNTLFLGRPRRSAISVTELPAGCDFDYLNSEVIEQKLGVENGVLTLPHGTADRLLVLPALPTMRPEILRRIRDLVKAGATVVGAPPSRSPSMENFPRCDQQVRQLAAEIWGAEKLPASGERPKFNGAHQPSRPGPYRSPLPVAQPEEVPEGEI
jgi:hypothetical protein